MGEFRLVATRANGCPAFVTYQRDGAGRYTPVALHVLRLTAAADQIAQIDDFLTTDERLFARFNLPIFA